MSYLMMPKNNIHKRIERLEVLKARVKSGEPTTIGQIATELGVSERTISRDIQILREQGLPIDADRGRGGGVRLDRHWGVGRVNFTYNEAVDLMISLAVAEQISSPLFMASLTNARHKIMASFSPSMKFAVSGMKARILIGGGANANMLNSFNLPEPLIIKKLHEAFLMKNKLDIEYKAETGAETQRIIEPHYLLLCSPIWYIIAWDNLRQDVRSFRCDRILKADILNKEFKLLSIENFKKAFDGLTII